MSDPIPFESYTLDLPSGPHTVLDPEGAAGYRVQMPSGEVQLLAAADNTAVLDAATLADLIAHPTEPVLSDSEAEALMDAILDGWAKEWGYASAARCVTYRGSSNPKFAAEADAMFAARDDLWTATAAAPANPETPPMTEANVRAFAAAFKPVRPEV